MSAKILPLKLRIPHTYAVGGTLAVASAGTNFLPPYYVPVPSGQRARLYAVRYKLRAGTATISVNKNGSNFGSLGALGATTTAQSAAPTAGQALADGDELAPVLSAVSGADGLSLTFWIDYFIPIYG